MRLDGILLPDGKQGAQNGGGIPDDRHVDGDVLVDARRVDIRVNFLGVGAEGIETAGNTVIEPGADIEQHVAAVHGKIGLVGAVHAEHAEKKRILGGVCAQAHQRTGAWETSKTDQLAKQRGSLGSGVYHTATSVDDRAASVLH